MEDKTYVIKGTTFNPSSVKAKGNQDLELYLRQFISPKINFTIEDFLYANQYHLVVFQIPAASNEPTTFKGKPYVRVDSHVTELTSYIDWMRTIYTSKIDWTAEIVPEATIADFDADAIKIAREGYKLRYPDFAEESDKWSDAVFLDKANITYGRQITRTALLLLGNPESAYRLKHIAQLVWKCYQDGESFGDIYTIPFIKSTTKLMKRIRNYRFKIYPSASLPFEAWKYDTRSILEGLNNCRE